MQIKLNIYTMKIVIYLEIIDLPFQNHLILNPHLNCKMKSNKRYVKSELNFNKSEKAVIQVLHKILIWVLLVVIPWRKLSKEFHSNSKIICFRQSIRMRKWRRKISKRKNKMNKKIYKYQGVQWIHYCPFIKVFQSQVIRNEKVPKHFNLKNWVNFYQKINNWLLYKVDIQKNKVLDLQYLQLQVTKNYKNFNFKTYQILTHSKNIHKINIMISFRSM